MLSLHSSQLRRFGVCLIILSLCGTIAVFSREQNRTWRHEGIFTDRRDTAFIQQRLKKDPWRSAWKDLRQRWDAVSPQAKDSSGVQSLFEHLTVVGNKAIVESDPVSESLLASYMATLPFFIQFKPSTPELSSNIRALIDSANAYELTRNNPDAFIVKMRDGLLPLLKERLLELETLELTLVEKAWTGVAALAVGVACEDEAVYKRGEETFLKILQDWFQDDGALIEPLPLSEEIELVSAMLLSAEIANHHSDIFWGNDLYHICYGPKNLMRVCSHLFDKVKNTVNESVEHWGWLELAAKTYGEPAWLAELKPRRPVIDKWAGGAATLLYAKGLLSGQPDFGTAPDGFQWLCNFKDLTGWQYSSRWYEIDTNDFFVDDGVFHTRGAADHYLMTDRMYENFILRLEYKIGKGSNSGIFIWAPIPGRPSRTGFEIQLLDDCGKEPNKGGSGALYQIAAPRVNAQKPAGEWNEVEIKCDNPHLTVILNGQTVQDLNLDDYPATQGKRRRGYIGLQDHSHRVAFRNVRIQVLE